MLHSNYINFLNLTNEIRINPFCPKCQVGFPKGPKLFVVQLKDKKNKNSPVSVICL